MNKQQKICNRCVMDTSAGGITFDQEGNCNYCSDFLTSAKDLITFNEQAREKERTFFINTVKKQGQSKKYDCIIGVSGGVDSSWALLQAVKHGLRPLAVHMDNGWNSELAQHNIQNLVTKLGVDLFTYVINWEEYKSLQQAFFDADVIDIELLYDNALRAPVYKQASRFGVKYILGGVNTTTEGMPMPPNWNWNKQDIKNIKSIYKTYGKGLKIKSFPFFGTFHYIYFRFVKKIHWISFIDYFDYNKELAIQELRSAVNFRPYPYKHYESVFTRFYQGYLLPKKFGVDKRKVHLSTLIAANQMSRDQALKLLQEIPYPSEKDLNEDIAYFLKKMQWTQGDLDTYIQRPPRLHSDFGSGVNFESLIITLRNKFSTSKLQK